MSNYECDALLPYSGLELENKIFLMQLLDIDGGPLANNRKTRLLSKYSKLYPDRFGVSGSERYKRTKWLLDRWKRDKDFSGTKSKTLALALNPDPVSKMSCYFSPQEEPSSKPTAKPRAKTKQEPKSPPAITRKMPPKFGSPFRLVRGLVDDKEHVESHAVDFNNAHQHGDYLVALCTEEPIGNKHCSCVVIARPNTHPSEIPYLSATVTEGSITLTSRSHSTTFLEQSSQWLDVLKDNKDYFKATKLITTVTAMCTKIRGENKKPPKMKKTTISFKDTGFELSNEHFNDGCIEGALRMLPLPYKYKVNYAGEEFSYSETFVIWRAFVVGSEEVITDPAVAAGNTDMDILEKLMKGNKIS